MRDSRSILRNPAAKHPRRSASAGLFALGLGIALSVTGCGDPSAGGGTELPLQVRITVDSRVEASEWRLWSIEETPSAARGGASGAYTFVSRGILADSAGVLSIPSDPGLFLLEAWVDAPPGDSLDVARASQPGFAIDSDCIQQVPLSGDIVRVQLCTNLDSRMLPSGTDSLHRPDQSSIIRIEGRDPQRLQLLDDAGASRLQPAEARLWSISTEANSDQTLLFRGRLSREADGTFRIPVLSGNTRYVLEASSTAGAMPTRISTHVRVPNGWNRYVMCSESVLSPLPAIVSVHSCPDLNWKLSSTDSTEGGADIWSVFSLDVP